MTATGRRFFLCVADEGFAASLRLRTVYPALSDPDAEFHGLLRIVDESGEDYLFPATLFVPIDVPDAAVKVFACGA